MTHISLDLAPRTVTGKKVASLRKNGFIPSVVYGGSDAPIHTQSIAGDTTKVVSEAGKHTPVTVLLNGNKKLAIIKEIDIDPVRHELRHIAFHAIKSTDKIVAGIPIILLGSNESPAERAGLVVLQAIEEIELRATAAHLPESIELMTSGLETVEDKLTLHDIKLPNGAEFADIEQDLDLVVANVYEPSALQAANDAAGGDSEGDAADVSADNGGDTPQDTQAEETTPGGRKQDEPKQSNVDANK